MAHFQSILYQMQRMYVMRAHGIYSLPHPGHGYHSYHEDARLYGPYPDPLHARGYQTHM